MFNWFKKTPEIPVPEIIPVINDGVLRCEDCQKEFGDQIPLTSPDSDLRGKTKTEGYAIVGVPTAVCKSCWYKNYKKMHPNTEPVLGAAYYE